MGNKIGDYIHLKYDNYLEHGISYVHDYSFKRPPNIAEIYNNQRAIIKNEIAKNRSQGSKNQIKAELENKLNYFFNSKFISQNTNQQDNFMSDVLQQIFIEAFNEKYKTKNIILNENLQASNSDLDKVGEIGSRYGALAENGKNSYLAIVNRLKQIEAAYMRMGQKANITESMSNVMSEIEKFSADWFDLIVDVAEYLQDLKQALKAANISESEVCTQVINDQLYSVQKLREQNKIINFSAEKYMQRNGQSGFAAAINKIYSSLQKATSAYYTGLAGEVYVAYMMAITPHMAVYEAKNILNILLNGTKDEKMKYGLVGTKSSPGIIKMDSIATTHDLGDTKDTRLEGKVPEYVYHLSNQSMKLKPTQDKVDMVFHLNQEIINASIKNYDLSSSPDLTLLSGSSLLKYIQQYPIFVNHYLNITASHSGDSLSVPDVTVKSFNRMIYLTVLLKALAGGVYKLIAGSVGLSQQAEIFVVNDNSKGGYKVYFIEDIINFLEQHLNQIEKYVRISSFSVNKNDWKNEQYGEFSTHLKNRSNAYRRVLELLNEIDKLELEVSMSSNVLKKI